MTAIAAATLLTASAMTGCDTASAPADGPSAATAVAASPEAPVSAIPSAASTVDPQARDVADRFLAAANAGDRAAVAALFAPDARFDSVGRIYDGRDDIMDRFLGGEVIDAGGQYTELSARQEGDRLVVEYDYDTGSGGEERFTYAYQLREGLIQDVIGRYV